MMRAIEESLDELNKNRRSRVLVIRGEGKDFCARLDLGRQNGRVKELHEHYEQVARVNHLLRSFPGVSLTLVQGKTSGFGFGLAAQSDLTIAEENAHFAFLVIRSGQPPTLPMSYSYREEGIRADNYGERDQCASGGTVWRGQSGCRAGSLQAEGQAWVSQLLAIEGAALGACKEFFRSTAHLSIEDTARHGVAFLVNFLAAKKS